MQSTGQASTQAVSFVTMQGSAMTYAMGHLPLSHSKLSFCEKRFKRGASWSVLLPDEKGLLPGALLQVTGSIEPKSSSRARGQYSAIFVRPTAQSRLRSSNLSGLLTRHWSLSTARKGGSHAV